MATSNDQGISTTLTDVIEAVWWQCHRRIVTDYLIAGGGTVFHIMQEGRLEPACMTPGAVVQAGGTVLYPAAQRSDA